jgi:hypothetical protein
VPCGPPVLLTSQNLLLPVRLVCCGPPVVLSSSVKNSVNDGVGRVEHQIPDVMLRTSVARGYAKHPQGDANRGQPRQAVMGRHNARVQVTWTGVVNAALGESMSIGLCRRSRSGAASLLLRNRDQDFTAWAW